MKCPHCNAENSEFSYKCVKCGKELASSPNVYKTDRDYESPIEKGDLYNEEDYVSPSELDKVQNQRNSHVDPDMFEDQAQQQLEELSRKIEDLVEPYAAQGGKAKSKLQKLLITYVILIIVFPIYTVVPIIGLIFCFKGLNEIKNNQQEKYKKTLNIAKTLIPVSIFSGIGIQLLRFFN